MQQKAGPKARYRIMMIAPTPFFADRGCHVRIFEEIKALRSEGHQVTVLTYHIGRNIQGIRIERTMRIPWYNKIEAGASFHKIYLDILLLFKCLITARSLRPHIIHAFLHEGSLIGWVVSRIFRIPLVTDIQGSLVEELVNHGFISKDSRWMGFFERCERWAVSCPHRLIVNTKVLRRYIVEKFKIKAERIHLIEDGVDTKRFAPRTSEQKAMYAKLGIPADKLVVVYLGLLTTYQGIDFLIHVALDISSHTDNAHFLIMGYPNVDEYTAKAMELGVEKAITFTGKIDYFEAHRFLSCGDVGVAPKITKTEGNGKVLNYMACGLPVVCFDLPQNLDLLGDSGVLVPSGDSSAMSRAIMDLFKKEEERIKLGDAARMRAMNYDWLRCSVIAQDVYFPIVKIRWSRLKREHKEDLGTTR